MKCKTLSTHQGENYHFRLFVLTNSYWFNLLQKNNLTANVSIEIKQLIDHRAVDEVLVKRVRRRGQWIMS